MEETEEKLNEVHDFWARHHLSTRIALISMILSYVAVVSASFFGVVIPQPVVDTVAYTLLASFAFVVLGVNGVKTALEGIAKIKGV
jgi:hypothetical protein